jgi:hypothetical protein
MAQYISVGGKKYKVTNPRTTTRTTTTKTKSSSSSSSSSKPKTAGEIIREARAKYGDDSSKFYGYIREESEKQSGKSSSRKTAGEVIREAREISGGDPKTFQSNINRLTKGEKPIIRQTISNTDKTKIAERLIDPNKAAQKQGKEELYTLPQKEREETIRIAKQLAQRFRKKLTSTDITQS